MNDATAGGAATARTIKVDALARVEGEGALYVRIKDGAVKDIKFRIFEPPRFFEALLRGRMFSDAPDITARICGICPVAYIMGASHAMEDALGVAPSRAIGNLRRLLYCGEWIESHVLHAAMLHAPDFLGLDDALQLAKSNRAVVEKALALKKLGNDILEVIGGRAVHPVNTRVGGFYKAPKPADIAALTDRLRWGADAAEDLALLFGGFDFPDYEYDYTCVSLRHPDVYAIEAGRLVSNRGLDIALSKFFDHFGELHVAHSNALHGVMTDGSGPYLVGPVARYNNNFEQLTERARDVAKRAGLGPVCNNPYRSIVVRMLETLYACEEALRLAEAYEPPAPPAAEVVPGPGTGYGCTEAPRGICFHRYELDREGRIVTATIVPPTAQNQPQIERDLLGVVEANMTMADEDLKWRCEQTIRNYDPCISCATHFLDLRVERGVTGPVLQPLVIGVGNRYRTDDGVGPFVADRLAERGVAAREASGEGASLIGLWEGVDAAIVVDAMASRAAPGSIRRFEGATAEIPAGTFAYSSHLFGVAEAVALARELGRLPPRLVLYGIEGESFAAGEALSPPVRAAAEEVVARILTDLAAWQAG